MPSIRLSSPSEHHLLHLNSTLFFSIRGRIKSIPFVKASIGSKNYIQNKREKREKTSSHKLYVRKPAKTNTWEQSTADENLAV